jgi:hypothetical protein
MVSRRSRPRRFLLPILLAAVLAAEITGLAIARSIAPSGPVSSSAGAAMSPSTLSAGRLRDDSVSASATGGLNDVADAGRDPLAALGSIVHGRRPLGTAPVISPVSAPTPARTRSHPGSTATAHPAAPTSPVRYAGRNHVWIPSLGINRSISSFACSRTRPPDNYVYRWGCSGSNNVYLLGHAYSVFKPLHDAYVGGRLRKGMKVLYADGAGHVSTYAVIWWRLVPPTTAASWAWAAQSRPSMTLQTCVGSNSQYRLMVRLVKVG